MSDLIKVSGLWKSEDREGNMVLSGNLNPNIRMVIFVNRFKDQDGEKAPDFNLFIEKREPRDPGK